MAGVLSTFITAYKTALTTAGFKAAPATFMRMDNLPVSNLHRAFRLTLVADAQNDRVYGGSGSTSLQEFEAEVDLELHWNPQTNADTIEGTIADDFSTAASAMLKQSNKTANGLSGLTNSQGIVDVKALPGQPIFRVLTRTPNEIMARGSFQVRYRETRDLS